MTQAIDTLAEYLSYDFVRYAFVSGALVSIAAALLGTVLVLRRLSYIGDGLSHVAFGAMALGAALGLAGSMAIVLPVALICSILLLRSGGTRKIRADAALAVLSAAALALGYLLMNLRPGSSNVSGDVCTSLFGSVSIITLESGDVALSIALSVSVIVFFALFRNRIFEITFDPDFASASGARRGVWETAIAVVSALTITLAMKLVGTLLVSALLVFPAVSAIKLCRSFRSTLAVAASIAAFTSVCGIAAAIVADTPVGATIVVCGAFILGLIYLIDFRRVV